MNRLTHFQEMEKALLLDGKLNPSGLFYMNTTNKKMVMELCRSFAFLHNADLSIKVESSISVSSATPTLYGYFIRIAEPGKLITVNSPKI